MSATTKARPSVVWVGARVLGALSLLAVGAVHLQQYFELYSEIPTIGTLFVLNFVGATIVGVALLAPVERLLGRLGGAVLALLTLAGVAPGYHPEAILAARIAEIATVMLLAAFAVARFVSSVPISRW